MRMSSRAGGAVKSDTGFDRTITWVEHATVGPPFVEAGATVFDLSGTHARSNAYSDPAGAPPAADIGYGLRFYIDYFGVRPGIMAVDVAFPLYDLAGNPGVRSPAGYIDFLPSFCTLILSPW